MQPIEEILKEFEDQYPEGEYDLDHDKVRAFIEQALIEREKEAKLERTKEILEILPEKALCRCGEGCFECYYDSSLSQIKELLTKTT